MSQHTGSVEHGDLFLRATTTYHYTFIFARNLVTSGYHAIEQCLFETVAKTANLTSRAHVHAKNRVGILQTSERELTGFHANVINVESTLVRLCIRSVKHDASCRLDEVAFQNLADKWEGTTCTQIALDYFHVTTLRQVLDIERSADVQFLGNCTTHLLYLSSCGKAQLLCREDHRGITRVNTSILNVFGDCVLHDFTVLSNCIELDLVGFRHEFTYDDGIFLAVFACHLKEALQLIIRIADVHGSSREDVRGTNQNGITDFVDELLHILHARQSTPSRLIYTELVEHSRELATILSTIDADRRSAKDGHTLSVEFHRKVVRNLSTC